MIVLTPPEPDLLEIFHRQQEINAEAGQVKQKVSTFKFMFVIKTNSCNFLNEVCTQG